MKFVLRAAVTVSAMVAVAACSSSSDQAETLTAKTLGKALNTACNTANDWPDQGVYSSSVPGQKDYYAGLKSHRLGLQAEFKKLKGDEKTQEKLDEIVSAIDDAVALDQKALDATVAGKSDEVTAISKEQDAAADKRAALYEAAGSKECAKPIPPTFEPSGTKPPADLKAVEVGGSLDIAAEAFLAAAATGDPKKLQPVVHSDFGTVSADMAGFWQSDTQGLSVKASEAYGPAGVVEVYTDGGYPLTLAFAADEGQGGVATYKFIGLIGHDFGGIRKAPKGNDADSAMKKFMTAIVDGDAKAFNAGVYYADVSAFKASADGFEQIGTVGSEMSKAIVSDIRTNKPEAVQLGINAAYSFWFIPGTSNDWIITQVHKPGVEKQYRVDSFWPIPKAE